MTPPPPTGDRRPIRQREHRPWQLASAQLASAGVTANAVSMFGMVAALLAAAALAATPYLEHPLALRAGFLAAAALIPLRLIANMLDGMVALHRGTASPIGELFNEVPDRISDAAVLIGLGYAVGGTPWLGWLAALLAVMTAYIRAAGKIAGAPQCFVGPMAKQHRMWVVVLAALLAAVWPAATQHHAIDAALILIAAGSALTSLRRLRILGSNLASRSDPSSNDLA